MATIDASPYFAIDRLDRLQVCVIANATPTVVICQNGPLGLIVALEGAGLAAEAGPARRRGRSPASRRA